MTQKDSADSSVENTALLDENIHSVALVLLDKDTATFPQEDGLRAAGCTAIFVHSFEEALLQLDLISPQIVFLPLKLGDKSSLPLLTKCTSHKSAPHVVVIATSDQINDAAEAMHLGALDCLFQPFSSARLSQVVQDSLAARGEKPRVAPPPLKITKPNAPSLSVKIPPASNSASHPQHPPETAPPAAHPARPRSPSREKLLGEHPLFTAALKTLDNVARSTAPVFLQGEVGTGKELFARAIHEMSGRPADRFIVVDCAALRPERLASEMFGHVPGAFPGLAQGKSGAALLADGGTLFLDEIANLDPQAQRQLIRFLRSGRIQQIGAEEPKDVDVRIISASAQDPAPLLASGLLLKDLYYHIHVASISIPPLRDRGADVKALANHFLLELSKKEGRGFERFSADALELLCRHGWPGNVHELKNTLWTAILQNNSEVMTGEMLPDFPQETPRPAFDHATEQAPMDTETDFPWLGRSLAEIEQKVIEQTIRACGGSIPKAARILGVSPSTIYRKREHWNT